MLVVLIFSVFFVLHFSFFHFAFSFCYALVFEIVPNKLCYMAHFRFDMLRFFVSTIFSFKPTNSTKQIYYIYICLKNKNQFSFFFILVFNLLFFSVTFCFF